MIKTNFSTTHHAEIIASHKNPTWWKGILSPEELDIHEKVAWMRLNWHWSVYASIAYLILIYGGQEYMKHRKPFNLKKALTAWNLSLATFSIIACLNNIPEFIRTLNTYGVYMSICGTIDIVSKQSLYWGYLFVFSKMLELGDTAFIVLRKRKLIFLHCYHHISVLVCVWLSSKDLMSTGAWFTFWNYIIHAMMYTYYSMTSLGIRVPRIMSMVITLFQINQMVMGLGVNYYALRTKQAGIDCAVTDFHIWLVFGMYFSYLVLFGNYFYRTYVCGEGTKKKRIKAD